MFTWVLPTAFHFVVPAEQDPRLSKAINMEKITFIRIKSLI